MENIMGSRIKQMRLLNDLTQKELADKLGVKTAAVNKWESGAVQNIKRSTIQNLASLFEVDPVWLMGLPSNDNVFKSRLESTAPANENIFKSVSDIPRYERLVEKQYLEELYASKSGNPHSTFSIQVSPEELFLITKYRTLNADQQKKLLQHMLFIDNSDPITK